MSPRWSFSMCLSHHNRCPGLAVFRYISRIGLTRQAVLLPLIAVPAARATVPPSWEALTPSRPRIARTLSLNTTARKAKTGPRIQTPARQGARLNGGPRVPPVFLTKPSRLSGTLKTKSEVRLEALTYYAGRAGILTPPRQCPTNAQPACRGRTRPIGEMRAHTFTTFHLLSV